MHLTLRLSLVSLICLCFGCSPLATKRMAKLVAREENKIQHHLGLEIFDLQTEKTVFSYRADRYFTPASNTKVLTFYTALNILGDSIPSIKYTAGKDSLIFWGLGDPCFLNPECFNNTRLFNFLKAAKGSMYFSSANFATTHFGNGWAWDDYNDYYSAERSPFSIYGNTFSVYPFPDGMLVSPLYFKRFLRKGSPKEKHEVVRDLAFNYFTWHPGINRKFKSFTIPFHTDDVLITQLLADTLHRKVGVTKAFPRASAKILYSIPSDSLYAVMMKESDNHLAEQLLLTCAAMLSDTLKPEIAIKYMMENHFNQYRDKPVWVDGSGLSRYNLFTARFMVQLWGNIYRKIPRERLFGLLATGGEPGTLSNWFKAETPYVFGKTGTVSNNHCLSGYLVTKSGKTLVFAFMNANYVTSTNDVRENMQRILNLYYENY
jgi:D-alanyl-D-alanine carboxypeptidase/D-alanyl-D-alanine-endopeptidase (penicillin-binding protein 4)